MHAGFARTELADDKVQLLASSCTPASPYWHAASQWLKIQLYIGRILEHHVMLDAWACESGYSGPPITVRRQSWPLNHWGGTAYCPSDLRE